MKPDMPEEESSPAVCQFLTWDSEFFGHRIARVERKRLSRGDMDEVLTWCGRNVIDCVYLLVDSGDAGTMAVAEDNGFHLVDIRVTLERSLSGGEAPAGSGRIHPVRSSEVAALRAIARQSHRDSRFYSDPRFSRERCDALYDTWIARSCEGYADAVLVAEVNGEPAGYVSCQPTGRADGRIGLLGVGEAWRESGVGRDLVEGALNWFASRGIATVRVSTQGRNRGAQRLYQRCGFLTDSLQLWYHRWFDRELQ